MILTICRHFRGRTTTGNPSSKYDHRRASALLRNIQNIKISTGKKTYRFCNLRKWKDFNKNSLPYLKCVLRLLCGPRVDLWTPFYGLQCKSASGPHRRDVTHILSKGNCFFYWNPFIFVGYRNDRLFPCTNSYISAVFRMLPNNADAHISSLAYLCF